MADKMRKRERLLPKDVESMSKLAKSFHAPQRDGSKRQRKKAKLNNYNDQKKGGE